MMSLFNLSSRPIHLASSCLFNRFQPQSKAHLESCADDVSARANVACVPGQGFDVTRAINYVCMVHHFQVQVLSGPKETPKFFWGRPDHLQQIYRAMSDYLDLEERADILNRRFSALTTMLDILRDQQSASHDENVEWIVILLIFTTTCLGLLQIASLMLSESFHAAVAERVAPA